MPNTNTPDDRDEQFAEMLAGLPEMIWLPTIVWHREAEDERMLWIIATGAIAQLKRTNERLGRMREGKMPEILIQLSLAGRDKTIQRLKRTKRLIRDGLN